MSNTPKSSTPTSGTSTSSTPALTSAYDLLDRYLAAVRQHLPVRRQHDILSELGANLHAEFEDRARMLGRPLTEEDQAALLRRHGHPMLVAARYLPQRSLIGPDLFPFYLFTLERVLPVVAGISLLAHAAVLVFVDQGPLPDRIHVGNILGGLFNALFFSLAIITAVFAALDWFKDSAKGKLWQQLQNPEWDPRRLPKADPAARPENAGPRHPYADAIASAVFLAWLLALPRFPFLLFGPYILWHMLNMDLPLIWHHVYWMIVGLNCVQLVERVSLLFAPMRRYYQAWETAVHLLGIGVLIYVLRVHDYVGLTNFGGSTLTAETVATINRSIHEGLLVVLLIAIAKLVWDTYQWLRPQPAAQIVSQQKKPA
jgi:hypothetical protein